MTRPEPAPARRVVVAGTTFGRMHLAAVRRCPEVELVALLARGSATSRAAAAEAGVPLITAAADVPDDVDLVCVAVRAASIGGAGTAIAVQLLDRGIAVLQELPVGPHDVTEGLRAARRGGTSFAVANLYRRLPSVRAFLAAARKLVTAEPPIAIDAQLSIQPAYALAHLLTEIGVPPRPYSFSVTDDRSLVTGTLGGVPVALRYATVLDAGDTDNDVRFPAVSVHTASGTLTLTDVHGPVRWVPTLHLPAEARRTASAAGTGLADIRASESLFAAEPSHADVLTELWPTALAAEIRAVLGGVSTAAAQRTLQVAQLWTAITSDVGFPGATAAPAGLGERAALLTRLRSAAEQASRHPATKDENEEPR